MQEAVIVAMGRSAVGRAPRGELKDTRPEELGAQVLAGVLAKVPNLPITEIDDVIVGCAFPEAEQGMNMARIISVKAGLGYDIPAQTVNRFCSSGLQTIATAAHNIMVGAMDVVVAGGVESMSTIPLGGNSSYPDPSLLEKDPTMYMSMGITAERVAEKYNVTRQEQDEFSVRSHMLAKDARDSGKFAEEIIPIQAVAVKNIDGIPTIVEKEFKVDEGIRDNINLDGLAKLRTIFQVGGTVTAGNASQTSDGAAFVVLMSAKKAEELGIKPIAKFVGFAVSGVPAEIMGIGPIKAIPKVLEQSNLTLEDIDLIELNEAFASQALAIVKDLKINPDIVNVNGGAIALGHPLGGTGSVLTVKLLNELRRQGKKRGIVSMCIGEGMGAAGIFELL